MSGDLGPVVRERRKSQALRIDDAAGLLGVSVLDGLGLALMVLPKEHPWVREAGHEP
jgi:hypothetical protein